MVTADSPAVGGRLDDRPDQQRRRRRSRADGAERVEPPRLRVARLAGQAHAPRRSPVRRAGTLTRNTADQLKCSTSNPPAIGPSATDRPRDSGPDADRRSRARCGRGKSAETSARVAGKISAAPMPIGGAAGDQRRWCSAKDRRAMSRANSASPVSSNRRRPNRSPSAGQSAAAWQRPACSRRPPTAGRWSWRPARVLMWGSATLTIVLSTTARKTLSAEDREDRPPTAVDRVVHRRSAASQQPARQCSSRLAPGPAVISNICSSHM